MSDINTELSAGVLRIELNRPDKKNAMTNGMYAEFAEILRSAAGDDAVHVVLWHGEVHGGAGDPWGTELDPALAAVTVEEVRTALDRLACL